jgi:hypothetical protein
MDQVRDFLNSVGWTGITAKIQPAQTTSKIEFERFWIGSASVGASAGSAAVLALTTTGHAMTRPVRLGGTTTGGLQIGWIGNSGHECEISTELRRSQKIASQVAKK